MGAAFTAAVELGASLRACRSRLTRQNTQEVLAATARPVQHAISQAAQCMAWRLHDVPASSCVPAHPQLSSAMRSGCTALIHKTLSCLQQAESYKYRPAMGVPSASVRPPQTRHTHCNFQPAGELPHACRPQQPLPVCTPPATSLRTLVCQAVNPGPGAVL